MRISTNTIYQSAITKISNLQSDQSRLQQQIATSKKILTPSDDPVGSSRVLELSQAKNMNTQYKDARSVANTRLGDLDISLDSITEALMGTQTTLVGAAGTLSSTQRTVLAIQMNSTMDTLLGLANTQDAAGNYIYAGFQNKTKPFSASITGATYNGDSNQQSLQIDAQRQMIVNETGDDVFKAGGNDLFQTLSDLMTLLNNPTATDTAVSSGVATALASIKNGITNVATIRSTVGHRMNELDALNTVGDSRELQYSQAISDIQDLDYAQALSDLSQKQVILEAAQKSFAKTTSLSLFDYIR